MKKKIYRSELILFYLLLLHLQTSIAVIHNGNHVLLACIPKSGTWLLEKCLRLLTGRGDAVDRLQKEKVLHMQNVGQFDEFFSKTPIHWPHIYTPTIELLDICTNLTPYEHIVTHLIYRPEYERLFIKKGLKVILMIRDPRDQIISRIFYVYNNTERYKGLQALSISELIEGYIGDANYTNFPDLLSSHIAYESAPEGKYISNIKQFYDAYLPWGSTSICYVMKFENLVGCKGGGNDAAQLNEIRNLASFLNLNVGELEIQNIVNKLFGKSLTFREGTISNWKKYFSDSHKAQFKKVAGQLLIDLKYETDFNW